MPRLEPETIGTGDQSWLASSHAIWNCRTVAPDPSAFTAVAYPNGVPSGTPLAIVDGLAVPFDKNGDGNLGVLAGFLFTDQKAPAEGGWPMLWHGAVRPDRLPEAVRDDMVSLAASYPTTGLIAFVTDATESEES